MNLSSNKIVVIVGPTASGKSEFAVKIAKQIGGEIISADSRQVYRGMDIGTGKINGHFKLATRNSQPVYIYQSIPHYGIDIVSPRTQYSVAQFQTYAKKIIITILRRGKVPIICGGTGHWIDAIVFDQKLPEVKPNPKLRRQLENKTTDQLFAQLKQFDPSRARLIDPFNRRRLVRALEIILSTKEPVKTLSPITSPYTPLWLGIKIDQATLYKKIDKRLTERLETGMIKEVKNLHKQSVPWKRLEQFGLEYKYCALYLQKKLPYEAMVNQLSYAIKHYAKRQFTWFKRNQNIHWIQSSQQTRVLMKKFKISNIGNPHNKPHGKHNNS